MAQLNGLQEGVSGVGSEGKINWMHVRAKTKATFGGLALDQVDSSTGVITTYYYWPSTSGALRYGATAPTTATRDSAGSAV